MKYPNTHKKTQRMYKIKQHLTFALFLSVLFCFAVTILHISLKKQDKIDCLKYQRWQDEGRGIIIPEHCQELLK